MVLSSLFSFIFGNKEHLLNLTFLVWKECLQKRQSCGVSKAKLGKKIDSIAIIFIRIVAIMDLNNYSSYFFPFLPHM